MYTIEILFFFGKMSDEEEDAEIEVLFAQDAVQIPWSQADITAFLGFVYQAQSDEACLEFFRAHPSCSHHMHTVFSHYFVDDENIRVSPLSFTCLEKVTKVTLFLLSLDLNPNFPESGWFPDENRSELVRYVSPMEAVCLRQRDIVFTELYMQGVRPRTEWMIHMITSNDKPLRPVYKELEGFHAADVIAQHEREAEDAELAYRETLAVWSNRWENMSVTNLKATRRIFRFLTNYDPAFFYTLSLPRETPTWIFMAFKYISHIPLLERFLRLFLYSGYATLEVKDAQGTAMNRMIRLFQDNRDYVYCLYLFYIHPEVFIQPHMLRTFHAEHMHVSDLTHMFAFSVFSIDYPLLYNEPFQFDRWMAFWDKDRQANNDVYHLQTLLSSRVLARYATSTLHLLPNDIVRRLKDYLVDTRISTLFRLFVKLRLADLQSEFAKSIEEEIRDLHPPHD